MKPYPTRERLKELFNYNPDSGVITRLKSVSNNAKKGSVVNTKNARGYILVRVDYEQYLAHRLVFIYMGYDIEEKCIDHINHNKEDNSWLNLRVTCHKGNGRNQSKSISNYSGFTGVCWHKAGNKWESYINHEGKLIHLGLHSCFLDAIAERIRANKAFGFHENHGK